MTNEEFIISRFNEVKNLGWVKSKRANNTGIGKTFEDYVGVVENNLKEPDLAGYEIKTHRAVSNSYVTLFTKSPSYPKYANAFLKNNFGEPYNNNPKINKLHTSIFASSYNTLNNKYSFKLINSVEEERIYIGVYTIDEHRLLDQSVYYTYSDLRLAFEQKLNDLFFVEADRKYEDSDEWFKFTKAEIYSKPSFDMFLYMLDNGEIMYDIRIGSYKSGKNYGKAHDHGSGFRIREANITKLYAVKKTI